MRTVSLWGRAMNIDHFAAGGWRCFSDAPQPHPKPQYTLQCVCFTCFLRFKNNCGLRKGEQERGARGCTLLQSPLSDFKKIKYRYWNLKKKVYCQKSTLMKKDFKDSLTVRILRPFLLPWVEMHFRRVLYIYDGVFIFCCFVCFVFVFQRKNALFPVFIFFSPQLAEGACNYPTQVIDYNLIENL